MILNEAIGKGREVRDGWMTGDLKVGKGRKKARLSRLRYDDMR